MIRPRRLARVLGGVGIVTLAIGAWRAFPRPASRAESAPPLRAALIDASAGTTRRLASWGLWARGALREEALAAGVAGEKLLVVLYGADVRRLGESRDPEELLAELEGAGGQTLHLRLEREAALGSELDRALGVVESELLAPGRLSARLTLLAARDYTGPDPARRLARLERGGVAIEWRAPPASVLPDLALEKLAVPRESEVGAPLVCRLDLALDPGAESLASLADRARIAILLDHDSKAGSRTLEPEAVFPPGPLDPDGYARWSVLVELGAARAGRHALSARVRLSAEGALRDGDPCPENDARAASWRVGEERVAAAVARRDALPALRAWIGEERGRWPGLQWIFAEPNELGALFTELDLLVSFDLGPRELPEPVVRELLRRGAGWFFCGGWRILNGWPSLGRQGRKGTGVELAELLPLAPATDDLPERDVVFVVDGSGSMAGEAFRRVQEALGELVLVAPEQDSLRLRFFTGTLGAPLDLDAHGDQAERALQRLFATRVPGGTTAILYSLELLAEQRAESNRKALVILLSDGQDHSAFDVERRGAELNAALAASGAELRVLAVGDDPDFALLSALIRPGEEVVRAEELENLGELFRREVFREQVREGRFSVGLGGNGALPDTAEVLAAWRRSGGALPGLERYVACEARGGADVLWFSPEHDEPLLAWQRAGGGLVAAWASAPVEGWASEYRSAEELLGPPLRVLARGRRREEPLRLESVGEELVLSGVPADWPARVEARCFALIPGVGLAGKLFEQELASAELAPSAAAPGIDPRTERRAPRPVELAALPGGAPLRVELRGEDGELFAQLALEVPPPVELTPGRPLVAPGPWTAEATTLRTGSANRRTESDPLAWCWVLIGSVSLFVAAVLGLFAPAKRRFSMDDIARV